MCASPCCFEQFTIFGAHSSIGLLTRSNAFQFVSQVDANLDGNCIFNRISHESLKATRWLELLLTPCYRVAHDNHVAVQKQRTANPARQLSRGINTRIFQDQYDTLAQRVAMKATSMAIEIRTALDVALFPDQPSVGVCAAPPASIVTTGDRLEGGAE